MDFAFRLVMTTICTVVLAFVFASSASTSAGFVQSAFRPGAG